MIIKAIIHKQSNCRISRIGPDYKYMYSTVFPACHSVNPENYENWTEQLAKFKVFSRNLMFITGRKFKDCTERYAIDLRSKLCTCAESILIDGYI